MSVKLSEPESDKQRSPRAQALLNEHQKRYYILGDRIFAVILCIQWLAITTTAALNSPPIWAGASQSSPIHLWVAFFLGGLLTACPVFLVINKPGESPTRHFIAFSQAMYSALFIHLSNGGIETSFHVFASLVLLSFYRDWKVLLTASVVMIVDLVLRTILLPQSIFGFVTASSFRWLEYLLWLIFENIVLIKYCMVNQNEMQATAQLQANLEALKTESEPGTSSMHKSKLSLNKNQYEQLCDTSPVGIFEANENGDLLYLNNVAMELLNLNENFEPRSIWVDSLSESSLSELKEAWQEMLVNDSICDVVLRVYLSDNYHHWVRLKASRNNDIASSIKKVSGILDDVTELKLTERKLRTQYKIANVLATAPDLKTATPKLLESICEVGQWQFGNIWEWDEAAEVLRCVEVWTDPSIHAPNFEEITRTITFASGIGLPGRVWQDGIPHKINDVVIDPNFPRAPIALEAGLHGAMGFPIIIDEKVVAVMEFFCTETRSVSKGMLDMMAYAGRQIGLFINKKQAEENIILLASIFESCNDAIAIVDRNGLVKSWNKGAEKLYGYKSSEMIGHHISVLAPAKTLDNLESSSLQGTKKHGIQNFETIKIRKDESTFYVDLTISPIVDKNNITTGASFISRDITERKLSQRTNEKMADIVNNSVDAIISISKQGIIESWNPGAETLFGYSAGAVLNKKMDSFLPEAIVALTYKETDHLKNAPENSYSFTRKDGSTVEVACSISKISSSSNSDNTTSLIIRDITHQKEVERQVTEFYSTISHELRSPLTSIRGALCMIDDEIIDLESDQEEAREMITIARTSSERLLRLINDILDLRKLESGKIGLQFANCKSISLLNESIAEMLAFALEKNIKLEVASCQDCDLLVDSDRIIQVLVNLISNAIKFSDNNSKVVISGKSNGIDKYRFSVTDTGIGIPTDQIHKLFNQFQQIDSSDTRQQGGTGLGLAICKAIVEQHGGIMGLESELGKGTNFWFELNAEKTAPHKLKQETILKK